MRKTRSGKGIQIILETRAAGRFEVVRRDRETFGYLKPVRRSQMVDREVDATEALRAWLGLWTGFRLMMKARAAEHLLRNEEERQAMELREESDVSRESLRQRAKHADALLAKFDEELVDVSNKFGPLGVGGEEIWEIMVAIKQLHAFLVVDKPELAERLAPGADLEPHVARVEAALANCDFRPGRVTAPNLYAALAARGLAGDLKFGVCDFCEAVFVTERSDKRTCSERCRSRLRYEKQHRKRG